MRTKTGSAHYALSPHHRTTLEADKKASVALMRYLKERDPEHTVIMVQPENEVGTYNQNRDHSAAADRLFTETLAPRQSSSRGTASAPPGRVGSGSTRRRAVGPAVSRRSAMKHAARH
jgi:hypothetical protein